MEASLSRRNPKYAPFPFFTCDANVTVTTLVAAYSSPMSYKRSRATYEADLNAPFAVFGTPLPDEAEARDDGSYLPLWKQEVRDERGRKRLHGAFTGGWSAG